MYIRVEYVEHSVDDVRDEVDVALSASSSCVHAKRLFGSKAKEQQFCVVDVELVRWLPLACALLQICVVSVWQREIQQGMIHCGPKQRAFVLSACELPHVHTLLNM